MKLKQRLKQLTIFTCGALISIALSVLRYGAAWQAHAFAIYFIALNAIIFFDVLADRVVVWKAEMYDII